MDSVLPPSAKRWPPPDASDPGRTAFAVSEASSWRHRSMDSEQRDSSAAGRPHRFPLQCVCQPRSANNRMQAEAAFRISMCPAGALLVVSLSPLVCCLLGAPPFPRSPRAPPSSATGSYQPASTPPRRRRFGAATMPMRAEDFARSPGPPRGTRSLPASGPLPVTPESL